VEVQWDPLDIPFDGWNLIFRNTVSPALQYVLERLWFRRKSGHRGLVFRLPASLDVEDIEPHVACCIHQCVNVCDREEKHCVVSNIVKTSCCMSVCEWVKVAWSVKAL